MNERTKRELLAVGKMALGSARIASGIATAVGKGLVGTYCGNHNLTRVGMTVARLSMKGGAKQFEEGWNEWHS
jgi:hypothetical protein